MFKRLASCLIIVLCISTAALAQRPTVRISAWYWLNSAPKADWEGDFVTMKNLGFTDVLISWGLDTAGLITRKQDTTQAIRWAQKAGMGAYLIVWQPEANSLPRTPEFVHINAEGKAIDSMDVFNPKWRATDWKHYLQEIAKTYGHEPAMAGYVFDDSFSGGQASYGPYEEKVLERPCRESQRTHDGKNGRRRARAGGKIGQRTRSNTFETSIRINSMKSISRILRTES